MNYKKKQYLQEYYQRNKAKYDQRTRDYYRKNPEKRNLVYKKLRDNLLEIFDYKCSRCGFSDIRALQIDHKEGQGHQEILKYGSSFKMYRFYLNNLEIAREKLQILCANCNWIKRSENHEVRRRGLI